MKSMSCGSDAASSAASIRSWTSAASLPSICRISATSIWISRFLSDTAPITFAMASASISGYARSPARSNAAQMVAPVPSSTVNIVGPDVCFIWITLPLMDTVLPIHFERSELEYTGKSFSILTIWYFFSFSGINSIFPFDFMFFTRTWMVSPTLTSVLMLLE